MLKSKGDDEAALKAMKSGTLEWQAGVAERFTQSLAGAVNARMNAASDKFQKDMGRAAGKEGPIVQAIIALRKEMAFLADAMDLPAIPAEDRPKYVRLVREQAEKMQASLDESAKKDRSGKMSGIARSHRLV